jgi:hypothetical protein
MRARRGAPAWAHQQRARGYLASLGRRPRTPRPSAAFAHGYQRCPTRIGRRRAVVFAVANLDVYRDKLVLPGSAYPGRARRAHAAGEEIASSRGAPHSDETRPTGPRPRRYARPCRSSAVAAPEEIARWQERATVACAFRTWRPHNDAVATCDDDQSGALVTPRSPKPDDHGARQRHRSPRMSERAGPG